MSGNSKAQEQNANTSTKPKPSREEIRNAVFGAKPKTRLITFFGQEIELRQPLTGAVLDLREQGLNMNGMKMLMEYAYVPGTDEKVFEPTDEEILKQIPFGTDMQELMMAVAELLGFKGEGLEALVQDAMKRVEVGGPASTPSDEPVVGAEG